MTTPPTAPRFSTEANHVAAVLSASRRVIDARANPKLEWGQTRAMEELSFALDELTLATIAYENLLASRAA